MPEGLTCVSSLRTLSLKRSLISSPVAGAGSPEDAQQILTPSRGGAFSSKRRKLATAGTRDVRGLFVLLSQVATRGGIPRAVAAQGRVDDLEAAGTKLPRTILVVPVHVRLSAPTQQPEDSSYLEASSMTSGFDDDGEDRNPSK